MRVIKITGGLLVVLIMVVIIAIVFGFSKLNSLVEGVIETTGTEMLQTMVEVDEVNIQLVDGKGEIQGIHIANPEGYSNNNIISLGQIGLQLDIESLMGDVQVIKQVYVEGAQLRAEQKNITDTNIGVLVNNLKNQVGSGNDTANTSTNSKEAKEDVRLMIESLRFGESEITLETESYGGRTLKLPAYSQTNIGDKSVGLSPDELSQKIMAELLSRAKNRVKEELKELAKDKVKTKAKEKLQEKLEEKLGSKVSSDDIDKLKKLFK